MFEGKAGQLLAIPSENGEIDQYVFGMGERGNSHPMVTGLAASQLKDGEFDLKGDLMIQTLLRSVSVLVAINSQTSRTQKPKLAWATQTARTKAKLR